MRPSTAKEYQPVNQRESVESSEKVDVTPSPTTSTAWSRWSRWLPWILVSCLVLSNWYALARPNDNKIPGEIFSPASHMIKYKNVVFQAGIDSDMSPYQGPPSPESDKLWEDLHEAGVSRIPMSEAARLTDRTSPIPDTDGEYVVILEVFHQLHCLSHLRRRLWYNGTESLESSPTLNMKHLDHCIDSIRQSLMCSSDVTPLPFVWWSKYDQILPTTAVTHTCRDFDALNGWAKERRAPVFDKTVKTPDPLGDTVVYDLY